MFNLGHGIHPDVPPAHAKALIEAVVAQSKALSPNPGCYYYLERSRIMLIENFVALFLEAAPWLVLGFVVAGMMRIFIPMAWLQRQLGQSGFMSTIKAALLVFLCHCVLAV